jgi:hypothetical protein
MPNAKRGIGELDDMCDRPLLLQLNPLADLVAEDDGDCMPDRSVSFVRNATV